MHVRVRHTYDVRFIPARCRNPQHARCPAIAEGEIREVDAADTRPAFLVSHPDKTSRFAAKEDGSARLIISHAGLLWLEMGDARKWAEKMISDYVEDDFLKPTEYVTRIHGVWGDGNQRAINVRHINDVRMKEGRNGDFRMFEDDNGAKMGDKIRRRLADAIVVDGILYVRDYEPVLKVERNGEGLQIVTFPDPWDRFRKAYGNTYDDRWSLDIWRADRLKEAKKMMRQEDPDAPKRNSVKIEVLDPSQVTTNDDGQAVLAALSSCTWALSYTMDELDRHVADAFYDLRDAWMACRTHIGPAIIGAARAVAKLPDESTGVDGGNGARLTETVATLRKALARWESHPADGREWVSKGLPVTSRVINDMFRVTELLDRGAVMKYSRFTGRNLLPFADNAASGDKRIFIIQNGKGRYDFEMEKQADTAVAVMPSGGGALDLWSGANGSRPESDFLDALRAFAAETGMDMPVEAETAPEVAP
jgi:hypothetical protein